MQILQIGDYSECMDLLEQLKGKRNSGVVEVLVFAPGHSHPGVAREAADQLGEIGDSRAVEPLLYDADGLS